MRLKKYKLINLPEGTKTLRGSQIPGGQVSIGAITDDIAEKLYNQKSRYVAKVKEAPDDKK